MPYRTSLLDELRKAFARVDVVTGWESRGNGSFNPAGVVCHWTAGPRGTARRASLDVVTKGTTTLMGPLCNVYLDREGIPVIVAAGRANHAGAGGYDGLVGNSSVYGIEAESAGNNDWTEAQKVAYPLLVATLLKGIGQPASRAIGHCEWAPTRKVDINDWTMDKMRVQVAKHLEGDDVALTDNEIDRIAARVWTWALSGWDGKPETNKVEAWRRLVGIDEVVNRKLNFAGNPLQETRDRVIGVLPADPSAFTSGFTLDQIATAVADKLTSRLAT